MKERANEINVVYNRDDPDGNDQFFANDSENPLQSWELTGDVMVVENRKDVEIFSLRCVEKVVISK